MDPYLELPALWPDVHHRLLSEFSDQLAAEVSPHFYVRIEERVYITSPGDPGQSVLIPDPMLVAGRPGRGAQPAMAPAGVITAPTLYLDVALEIHDRYLEIRERCSHQVVTVIELLSPANKIRGSIGRGQLERKKQDILGSAVHWIEIDLLRSGERLTDLGHDVDYYALLIRAEERDRAAVWTFGVRDPLPTIAVPLRPPFADVPLDLGRALSQAYDRAHYADSLDYTQPPQPPLTPADADWAREQVSLRDRRPTHQKQEESR